MSPHMYPESLMGVDVKSSAERTVFEAFQSQLDDDFYILHSVSWIEIRRKGKKPSDGEIDFVILHPKITLVNRAVRKRNCMSNCWQLILPIRKTANFLN